LKLQRFIDPIRSSPQFARDRDAPKVSNRIFSHRTLAIATALIGAIGSVPFLAMAFLTLFK
jgi:hypothetical protein